MKRITILLVAVVAMLSVATVAYASVNPGGPEAGFGKHLVLKTDNIPNEVMATSTVSTFWVKPHPNGAYFPSIIIQKGFKFSLWDNGYSGRVQVYCIKATNGYFRGWNTVGRVPGKKWTEWKVVSKSYTYKLSYRYAATSKWNPVKAKTASTYDIPTASAETTSVQFLNNPQSGNNDNGTVYLYVK